jgi:uncharacterized membrane protein
MVPYALEWLNLVVRWVHFVAGISWIGASFYFVWLDNHLLPPRNATDAANDASGELWAVHGGGFYHNVKYPTGPANEPLSENPHWFKWEAYTTWISGVAMLALVYWAGAGTFLIDKNVMNLTPTVAIAISIGSLIAGWLVYDGLCRLLERNPLLLGGAVFAFLTFSAWALFHVFGARAAYIQVGSIIGTIMVANVLFVIIPGQKKMLAQIRAGKRPDPRPGILGKTRSVHNTYLTLPVLFTMISGHYPMTYGSRYGWLVLVGICVAGVLVRYFFILSHKQKIVVALPVAAIAILAGIAIAIAPRGNPNPPQAVTFAQVAPIFAQRCAACHAAHPMQPGFAAPPAGVLLDTRANIIVNATRAYQQGVVTHVMPPANLTGMTDAERATIGDWIEGGAKP